MPRGSGHVTSPLPKEIEPKPGPRLADPLQFTRGNESDSLVMSLKSVYKLNTARGLSRASHWVLLALCLMLLTHCGKKCQTNTNSVSVLSGARWRMVESNDKNANYRKMNNYTTDIWSFDNQFRGQVIALVNNEEFNQTPKCTMLYKPADGQVAIQFSSSSTQGEDGSTTSSGCPMSGTIVFDYSLGRELRLTNIKTGTYYRFVQYLGIVEPDKVCTF